MTLAGREAEREPFPHLLPLLPHPSSSTCPRAAYRAMAGAEPRHQQLWLLARELSKSAFLYGGIDYPSDLTGLLPELLTAPQTRHNLPRY